ncbi:TIGR03745 family integrating conjugative element membrane protein [Erwinia sp. ACCC 02193]|uniref:TIGR03745 family integrating conjugative element membrane protein n=1 Tax=Erwinia aeris TaxID=3239803 RepID=A0ABV4ECW8_9GAMM
MSNIASLVSLTRSGVRKSWARTTTLITLSALSVGNAMADLPTVEQPTSGGGGGLMDTIKGYFQDGITLIGLVIAAVCFLKVAEAAITTFSEVREGRATWGKFGGIVIVGIVLLVMVIWLLGKSAEIVT